MVIITENFLIKDEIEAIESYKKYLNQGVKNPKIIPIIKRIIEDEERHIKMLKIIKKIKIR